MKKMPMVHTQCKSIHYNEIEDNDGMLNVGDMFFFDSEEPHPYSDISFYKKIQHAGFADEYQESHYLDLTLGHIDCTFLCLGIISYFGKHSEHFQGNMINVNISEGGSEYAKNVWMNFEDHRELLYGLGKVLRLFLGKLNV